MLEIYKPKLKQQQQTNRKQQQQQQQITVKLKTQAGVLWRHHTYNKGHNNKDPSRLEQLWLD